MAVIMISDEVTSYSRNDIYYFDLNIILIIYFLFNICFGYFIFYLKYILIVYLFLIYFGILSFISCVFLLFLS